MKKWQISHELTKQTTVSEILKLLFENRGFKNKKQIAAFLEPMSPEDLKTKDVGIEADQLRRAISRIKKAIANQESMVVYADYDADGICAGTIMFLTLYALGAKIMPYIPQRVEEGYGLSTKGIDAVIAKHQPGLIITVDHGITAWEKVEYAQKNGIDVIITDHHALPEKLPECNTVHTTLLSGAGIAWFIAKELIKEYEGKISRERADDLLGIAAIGTIADMMPLVDANRSISKFGIRALKKSKHAGLVALIRQAGLEQNSIGTYEISFMLAPRLNAVGRLTHALDAMRLLCTNNPVLAKSLAAELDTTNRQRQQMTSDSSMHAIGIVQANLKSNNVPKILVVSDAQYNQGVIGLIAGKLVEAYYRPSIVISKGELVSKGSVRSIAGFNIIEFLRLQVGDILVDVGGHPMAAGFTIETSKIEVFTRRLLAAAEAGIDTELFTRLLPIDIKLPLSAVTSDLWEKIRDFSPFGFGNPEPVFASGSVRILDARTVGTEGKHLKLRVSYADGVPDKRQSFECIGFGMGGRIGEILTDNVCDMAYTIDMNEWNGNRTLQLKIRDIHPLKVT